MKGLFLNSNSKIYQLVDPCVDKPIIYESEKGFQTMTNTEINTEAGVFTERIAIKNFSDAPKTNGEMYEDCIARIKSEDIKSIDRLLNKYCLEVEYQLYDNADQRTIKSGILTDTFLPYNRIQPLGLSATTNEIVSVFVKRINKTFELEYKTLGATSKSPFINNGISSRSARDLTLYIRRIKVKQLLSVNTADSIDLDVMNRLEDEYTLDENYITLLDSHCDGYAVSPTDIKFDPTRIEIKIDIMLGNYYFTTSESDVLDVIAKNNTPAPTVTPSTDTAVTPTVTDNTVPTTTDTTTSNTLATSNVTTGYDETTSAIQPTLTDTTTVPTDTVVDTQSTAETTIDISQDTTTPVVDTPVTETTDASPTTETVSDSTSTQETTVTNTEVTSDATVEPTQDTTTPVVDTTTTETATTDSTIPVSAETQTVADTQPTDTSVDQTTTDSTQVTEDTTSSTVTQ